jgi:hypothetical protein
MNQDFLIVRAMGLDSNYSYFSPPTTRHHHALERFWVNNEATSFYDRLAPPAPSPQFSSI